MAHRNSVWKRLDAAMPPVCALTSSTLTNIAEIFMNIWMNMMRDDVKVFTPECYSLARLEHAAPLNLGCKAWQAECNVNGQQRC